MTVAARGTPRVVPLSVVLGAVCWLACNARPVEDDPIPAEVRAYAQARCLRIEQCECDNATYDDRADCEARLIEIYQEEVEGRDGIDLGCFAASAEIWRTVGCDEPHGDPPCNTITRADPLGTACNLNPFRDIYAHTYSCAEGLLCYQDRCVEPVVGGEPGDPCSPYGVCDDDLTCIAGQCERPRMEGEACEITSNCEPIQDLYCGDGVCLLRKSAGDDCIARAECRSGVPCVNGRCSSYEEFMCALAEL